MGELGSFQSFPVDLERHTVEAALLFYPLDSSWALLSRMSSAAQVGVERSYKDTDEMKEMNALLSTHGADHLLFDLLRAQLRSLAVASKIILMRRKFITVLIDLREDVA